jgi:hypothetical protein
LTRAKLYQSFLELIFKFLKISTINFRFYAVILYQIVRMNITPAHTAHHLQNPEFEVGYSYEKSEL